MFSAGAILQFASELAGALHVRLDPEDSPSSSFASSQSASRYPSSAVSSNPAHPHFFLRDRVEEGTSVEAGREAKGEKKNNKLLSNATFQDEPEGFVSFQTSSFSPSSPHSSFSLSSSFSSCSHSKQQAERVPSPPPPCPSSFSSSPRHLCQRHLAPASPLASVETDQRHLRKQENRVAISTVKDECFALPTPSTTPFSLKNPLSSSSSSSSVLTPSIPSSSSSSPLSLSSAKNISQEIFRPSQNPYEETNSGVKRRGDSLTSLIPDHRHLFLASSFLSPPPSSSSPLAPSSSSSSSLFCSSSSLPGEKGLSRHWMNEEEIEKDQIDQEKERNLSREAPFLVSPHKEPSPPHLLTRTTTMGAEQSNRSGGGGEEGREGLDEDILQRQGRRSIIEGREEHLSSSSSLGFPSQGQSARPHHHLFRHSSEAKPPPYPGDTRGGEEEGVRGERDGEEEEEERSSQKGSAFQNLFSSAHASPHLPSSGHEEPRDGHGAEGDAQRRSSVTREGREEKEEARRRGGGSHVGHTGGNSSSSNSGMPASTSPSTFASGLVPSVLSRSATWASSLLGRRSTSTPAHQTPTPNQSNNASSSSSSHDPPAYSDFPTGLSPPFPLYPSSSTPSSSSAFPLHPLQGQHLERTSGLHSGNFSSAQSSSSSSHIRSIEGRQVPSDLPEGPSGLHSSRSGTDSFTSSSSMAIGGFDKAYTSVNLPPKKAPVLPPHFLFQPGSIREAILQPGVAPDALRHRSRYHYCHHPQSSLQQSLQGREEEEEGRGGGIAPPPSTEEYRKTSTGVYTRRSHQHDALPPHSYTSSYPSPLLPLYGRSFSSEEEGEEDLGEHRRQGEDEKIDEANSHLNSSRPDAGKDEKNRGKVLPLSSHFPHEGKGASEGRFSPLSSSTGAAAGADHPSVDREDEGSSSVARSDVDQRKGREEEEEEEEEEGDSSSSCLPQKKKKEKERGKQLSTEERGACGFKTSVSHSPHTPHRPQVHTELHQPQQVLSSSSFVPKEALERKEEGREEEEERGDQVTTFPPEHSNPFLPNRSSSSSSGGGGGGLFSFFLGGGERNHNSSQAIGTEEGEKGDTLLKRKGVNGVLSPKSHSHDSSSSSSSSSSTFASTLGGHQPSSLDGSLLMNSKASSRDSYFSSLRHHTHSYLHRTSSTQDQEKKDSHGERGSAGDVERGEDGEWNLVKNRKEEEKKEYFRRRGTALLDFWKDQQDKEDERIALQRGEAKCVYCAGDRLIPGVLSIEREALKFRREQDLQLLSSSSSSQSTDDSPRPLPPYVSISLIDVLECACVSPPPPPSSSSCVVEGEEDEEKHLPSTPLSPSSSSSSSSSSCYLNLSPLPLSASSSAHRLPSSSEGISESKKSRRDCLPWSASHNKNALSSSSSLVQSPRSEREREKLSHHDRDPVMYLQLLLSTLEASSHLKEEGQWDKRQDQHLQGKGSPCSSSQGDDGEKKEPKRNEGGGDKGDDSLEEGPRDKKEKKGGTTSKSHGGVGGVDDKRRREEQEGEEGKRRGEEEEKGEEGGLYPPMSMPIASNYDTPCSRFSPLSSFSSSDRLGGLVGGEGALAEKEEEKNKDDEEEKRKSRQETDDGEEKNEEEEKGLGNTGSSSSSTDEQRKKSTKQQEGHQDCRSLLSSHDKILPIPHEDKQHIQSSSSSSSEMLAKNIIKRPEPLQAGSPRPSLPSPDPLVSTDLPSSYHQPPHGHLSSPIPVDPSSSSSLHYYDPVDIVVGNKPPHVQNLVSTDKEDLSTTSPKITLSSSVVSPSSPSSSSCSPLPPPAPFAGHQKSRESHEEASSGSSPVSDLRRTTTGHPHPLESIPSSSSSSRHPDHHLTLSPSSFSPLSHHHDRSVYTPHDSAGDGEREGGGPLSQGSGMIGTGGRSSSSASFSLSPVRLLSSGAWGLMDLWRGLRRNHSSTAAVTCASSSSSPMLEGRGDTSAGDVGGGDPRGIGGGGGRRESRGEEALPGGRLATEGGHRFRRRLSGLRGSDGMREEEERGGGGSRRHSLLHRTDTAGTVSSYHRRKKDLFTRQEGERNRDHSFSSLSRSSSSPPLLFVLFGFYKKDLALGITRAVLQFIDQCQSEHRGFRVVGTHVPFSSNALVDRWRGVGDDPSSMINSSFHHRGPAGEGGDMAVPTCSSPSLSVRSFNSLGSGEMTMTVTPQNPPSFSSSSSYYPHASSQHPHRRSPTRGGDERTISEEDLHRRQAGLPSSSSLAPSQLTLSPQARPHGGRLYRADSSSFSYQPPSRLSSSPRHKRRSSLSSSHEPPRIRSSTENDYPERNPTKEEEEEAEEGLHRRRHSITGLWHATHHRQDETKHRRKSKTSVSSSASPASLSFSSRLVSPVFHQHPDQQGSSSSSHFHRRASDVVTGAVGLGRRNSDTKNAGGGMMTRGRYSFLLHRNASSSSTSPIPGGDSHQLMREEERERDKKPGRDGILELQDDHEEEDNRKRDSHEEDDDEEEEEEYDDEDEEEGSGENLVYADEPEQEEMYNKGEAYSLSSTHNFGSFRSRDRDLGSTSSLFTIPLPDYEIPQGAPALLNNNVVSQLAVHLPLMLTMKKWYLAFCHKLHGISLNTFYRRCSNIGPCVLLIQDGKGVLFGAFLDEIQLASKYYGTAETFVFTFKGSHGSNPDLDHASIHVYRWSKMNNYFIYTDYDVIGIGGGGHYAISVDKDLLRGSSSCCFTFNSPILSSSEDFIVKAFQVWSFEDY